MPNGYSSLGGQVLNPYDIDPAPAARRSGSRRRGRRRPGARSRSAPRPPARSSAPPPQQGVVGLRPTVGLVSRTGILPISRLAGHGRADDPDGRRRRGRAAGDRRQGPEDPATDARARHRPELPRRAQARRARRASGSASSTTPTRSTRPRSPRSRRSARPRCRSRRRARRRTSRDILTAEFKRDLNAYLGRLPASAPMKSLADIIAFNTAHADEALKFGQTPAHRQPGHRPDRPGDERRPTSPTATAAAPPPAPRSTTR